MYINIGEFNNALPVKLKVSRNIMPQAHTTDNIIKEDILHSKAFKKVIYLYLTLSIPGTSFILTELN